MSNEFILVLSATSVTEVDMWLVGRRKVGNIRINSQIPFLTCKVVNHEDINRCL